MRPAWHVVELVRRNRHNDLRENIIDIYKHGYAHTNVYTTLTYLTFSRVSYSSACPARHVVQLVRGHGDNEPVEEHPLYSIGIICIYTHNKTHRIKFVG